MERRNMFNNMTTLWKTRAIYSTQKPREKTHSTRSQQHHVIFHLYCEIWYVCICAINHFGKRNDTHSNRAFITLICSNEVAFNPYIYTHTQQIYALAFSILILPKFLFSFFFSFFISHPLFNTCMCISCIVWNGREKKNTIYQKSHEFGIFHVTWLFLLCFVQMHAFHSKFVDNNKYHWLNLRKITNFRFGRLKFVVVFFPSSLLLLSFSLV